MRQTPVRAPPSSPSRWAEAPPPPATSPSLAGEREGGEREAAASSRRPEEPLGRRVCVSFPVTGARTVHDDELGNYAFPTAIEPCSSDVAVDVSATLRWAEANASELERALKQSGALLLRGFETLRDPAHFDAFTTALGYPEVTYDGAGGGAHLELAQRSPHRVVFHCADARAEGLATPLLDAHRVYLKLKTYAPAFVDELELKGVRYARVMTLDDRPHSPIGRGWRKTFGVNGPTQLEKKLAKEKTGDVVEWLDAERFPGDSGVDASMYPLRHYGPVMDAVLLDDVDPAEPGKKRKRFFNQIFAAHRGWTDDLNAPGQSVVFGDGGEMPWEAMAMMARVFEEESVVVPWCVGDVLLIDNLRVMHSKARNGKNAAGFANGVVPRRALRGEEAGDARGGNGGAHGGAVARACSSSAARVNAPNAARRAVLGRVSVPARFASAASARM